MLNELEVKLLEQLSDSSLKNTSFPSVRATIATIASKYSITETLYLANYSYI